MKTILINGNFLCRNLTGIERYAFQVCSEMDKLLDKSDDIALLVPANAKIVPEYTHIKIIRSKKKIKSFPLWDLIIFALEAKKRNAIPLNFSNTAPLGYNCGVAYLHDIYAHDYPADFTTFKDKLIRIYSNLNYANIAKNATKIITVSHFSKERIVASYGVKADKIAVIGNGWEHFKAVKTEESIFERFPNLIEKKFYFTLGSLSRRKNLSWILQYAKKHPYDLFAISGKAISGLVPKELEEIKTLKNVVLLGYVTDGEVKALMKKCKAFIFPSYYEGFGIPPLEALSEGARVICAKAASLPEIFGNSVHYIDPYNTDCNLDELLEEQTKNCLEVLEKYTYKNAAKSLLDLLKRL